MYSCCRCNGLAVYGTFCAICYHPHCLHCLHINNDIAEIAMDWLSSIPTLVLPAPAYFQEIEITAGMHICPGCETRAIFRDLCAKCEEQQTKTKLRGILWKDVQEFEHMEFLKASLINQMATFVRQYDPITPARPTFDPRWLDAHLSTTETDGARWESGVESEGTLSDPFVTPTPSDTTTTTNSDGTRQQSVSVAANSFTTPETETDGTRRQSDDDDDDDDWEAIQSGIEETRGRFQTAVSALDNNDVYWTCESGNLIIP